VQKLVLKTNPHLINHFLKEDSHKKKLPVWGTEIAKCYRLRINIKKVKDWGAFYDGHYFNYLNSENFAEGRGTTVSKTQNKSEKLFKNLNFNNRYGTK
jgi:hypothetical protein